MILAYYAVETAVVATLRRDDAIRDRLHQATEALDGKDSALTERIQAQADRLTPDLQGLQDVAMALRDCIALQAGEHSAGGNP